MCVSACGYVRVHTIVCVRANVCMCACVNVCIVYENMYLSLSECVCVCARMCIFVCACVGSLLLYILELEMKYKPQECYLTRLDIAAYYII